MITREQVMEYFRSDAYIEEMSIDDRDEIALDCVAYSDNIHRHLEKLLVVYWIMEENK